jgi:hypothetical protein
LGDAVEPEVYCRIASASGAMSGGDHACIAAAGMSSVATSRTLRNHASSPSARAMRAATWLVVSAVSAPASATMERRRPSMRERHAGNVGTAIAPA